MGIRPLTFLVPDAQPTDPWTREDKLLLMAWTILEKESCRECGNPLWICRSSDNNIYFSVKKGFCYAKAKMEKWAEDNQKKTKKGEVPYTVASRYDEKKSFPTRGQYLSELNEDE